jgi:hypothetical protein
MTIDEPNDQAAPENDFAAFEAAAQEPAPVVEGKKPAETKPDDTLELGGDDAPEVKEGEEAEGERKGRSKRWEQRVDNLTARLRDAERRALDPRIGDGVYKVLTPAASAVSRKSYGGTAPDQVRAQIQRWKEILA